MKASPHPPLSVLNEGLLGRDLPSRFGAQHRMIYDLVRTWQISARLKENLGAIDFYRAEIVDQEGHLWPIVFRSGPELPEDLERLLPPRISHSALEAVSTLQVDLRLDATDSPTEWTTPVSVDLLDVSLLSYCGALPGDDPAEPEWLPISDLMMRCAADDTAGAHKVAEALGLLEEGGFIESRHQGDRFYIRLSESGIEQLRQMRAPPPTLAEIGAAHKRFEQAPAGTMAAAVAAEARLIGLGDVDPASLAWLDRIQISGESAETFYSRIGSVLPDDRLWSQYPLPPNADPATARPDDERAGVLVVLDEMLAGATEAEKLAWGEADPLQRLDRRLEAAAALLGMARSSLEDALRYNLHARWLLDYPLPARPIQNGMGPLGGLPDAEEIQQAADVLRSALRLPSG